MQMQKMIVAAALAVAHAAAWGDAPPQRPPQKEPAPARDDALCAPVTEGRLAAWRGGAEVVSSAMKLQGTVAGNTATNVVSGANTISSGAFSNAAGLPVAIQNSGANVLIQNATIINIQLQ